jgi:hypothetical protein
MGSGRVHVGHRRPHLAGLQVQECQQLTAVVSLAEN